VAGVRSPRSAATGVITGTVTDRHGIPMADVAVSLRVAPAPVPDIAALTGPDGSFSLAAPSAGHYTVVATDARGESAEASVVLGPGEDAAELRIVIR
jgi:hypothetical protein